MDSVPCPVCGAQLDQAEGVQTCPECGSVTVFAPTATATATAPTPSVSEHWPWTSDALTLAAVLYGTLITVVGVVLAPLGWVWRISYAAAALTLLGLGLFVFRDPTVRLVRRYLRWTGRGRTLL